MDVQVRKLFMLLKYSVIQIITIKNADGFDYCCRPLGRRKGNYERWSDSGFILEVKSMGFWIGMTYKIKIENQSNNFCTLFLSSFYICTYVAW